MRPVRSVTACGTSWPPCPANITNWPRSTTSCPRPPNARPRNANSYRPLSVSGMPCVSGCIRPPVAVRDAKRTKRFWPRGHSSERPSENECAANHRTSWWPPWAVAVLVNVSVKESAMVVSISKMSIAYYLSTVAKGDVPQATTKPLTAYYTETATPPGRWWGNGLAGLSGLADGQQVDRRDAIAIYDDLTDPATGEKLGRSMMVKHQAPDGAATPKGAPAKDTRDAVAGFDLTFSVPKSVSTLWAVAGPALQQAIHQAHLQAVNETMAWTEREFIQSRAGKGGVAHVPVKGLIASIFDHWDSREGDPQLHTHVVVSNRVQRLLDNQWVTLDSYTLHRHVVAISETYNSVLFDHLHNLISARPEAQTPDDPSHEVIHDLLDATTQDTATAEDVAVSGMSVELAGVPEELIREFSQRSVLIEQRTDELIEQYVATHGHRPTQGVLLQLRQQATLETRSHKSEVTESLAEKMAGWRDRTLTAGHDPAEVIAQATGHDSQVIGPEMLTDDVREQLADWV